MTRVNVAEDFSRYPSGRYKKNGNTSGEEFREKLLEPPLRNGDTIELFLDGTIGYGSSFLEEAFGGLVRSLKTNSEDILKKISFVSNDTLLVKEIEEYILDAAKAKE